MPANTVWYRPLKNAGVLAIGRGAKGLLSLAYTALAARALGVEAFGMLVLLHGLIFTITELARFKSWQAVMKYGATYIENRDVNRLSHLLSFAFRLDLLSAAIALLVFNLGLETLSGFVGLPPTLNEIIHNYSLLVIFLALSSCPLGILRLLDRHDLISWHTVVEAVVRFIGAGLLFLLDGSLTMFVTVWFIATALSRLFVGFAAFRLLGEFSFIPPADVFLASKLELPKGSWRFVMGTHLISSLNLNNTHLGVLLTGALLGPVAAGYYRVAHQFGNILSKPTTKLLVPAIYTDIVELTARRDTVKREIVVFRSIWVATATALGLFSLLVVAGEWLIGAIVGAEFTTSYPTMLALAAAGLLGVLVFPLEPLLISVGRIREVLVSRAIAMAAYLCALHSFVLAHGLIGAGMAALIAACVTSGLFWIFGSRALRSTVIRGG